MSTRLSRDKVVAAALAMTPPATQEPSEPHVVIPEWMTPAQVESINKLYNQNPNGSETRAAFFNRVQPSWDGSCGLWWCQMYIGIEKDGYTHS